MTAVVSYLPTASYLPTRGLASSGAVTPRLRLTRRGRVVFATLAAIPLVIAALVFGLGAGGAVATQDGAVESLTWVTVDGGQSLWDLAAEIAPADDPREFVAQVAAFNQLDGAVLQPGQQLAIPTQYTD